MRYRNIVAWICMIVMTVSCHCYGALAQEETPLFSSEEARAIACLKGIGVADEKDFADAGVRITRGYFVQLVMNVIGGADGSAASGFLDVDVSSSEGRAIAGAERLGLICGDADGNFYPKTVISGAQAVKIVVSALGCGEIAEEMGGYPHGYALAGKRAGLPNEDYYNDSPLTAGQAARLLVDSLHCHMAVRMPGMDGYVIHGERTWMNEAMGIYRDYGIVTATELSRLTEGANIKKGTIEVDGVLYGCDEDYTEMLGYRVEYYYRMPENADIGKILCMSPENNNVLNIKAEELRGFEDGRLFYDVSEKRTAAISIPAGCSVIYNHQAIGVFTADTFHVKSGYIEAISNDGDSSYEVIKIYDYQNIWVDAIRSEECEVSDKLTGGILNLRPEDGKFIHIIDELGNETDFASIQPNDILTVLQSKSGNAVWAYIGRTTIQGVLSGIQGGDESEYIIVDGQKMRIAVNSALSTDDFRLSAVVTVYLNMFGDVAAFSYAESSDNFCYIIKSALDRQGFNRLLRLKVLLSDGTVAELEGDPADIKLNGHSIKAVAESGVLPDEIAAGGLVLLKRNKEGHVCAIETPDAQDSSLLSFGEEASLRYYSSIPTFEGKFYLLNDAKIFLVPEDEAQASDENYQVGTKAQLLSSTRYDAVAGFVTQGKARYAEAVVVRNNGLAGRMSSEHVVVKEMFKGIDQEGNEVEQITLCGYTLGTRTFAARDSAVLDGVSIGDVVTYKIDVNQQVESLMMIYDCETDTLNPESNNADYGGVPTPIIGNVLFREENLISVISSTELEQAKNGKQYKYRDTDYLDISMGSIWCVDPQAKGDKVYKGDSSNIDAFLSVGKASKVFVGLRYGIPRLIVVYL